MKKGMAACVAMALVAAIAARADVSADLWISNHTDFPNRRIVLDLTGKTNFIYDAKGATLMVHDPAIALHLKNRYFASLSGSMPGQPGSKGAQLCPEKPRAVMPFSRALLTMSAGLSLPSQ